MSHAIVSALKGSIDQSFGMIKQYIEVCPENIWVETSGGWPVWQQIYHAVNAVNFFTTGPNDPMAETLVSGEYCGLQAPAPPEVVVTREEMQTALKAALQDIEALVASLDDSDLTSRNEGVFQRIGMDITMAGTLCLLVSHTQYHLGSCDAALRNHGIPGVF